MTAQAIDRFFALPELVERTAWFLRRHDLIQLLQTNRTINAICTPTFWQEVMADDHISSRRLLESSQGLKAFRNNINSVKSVKWDINFSWPYIAGVCKYFDSDTVSETHKSLPADALFYPGWGQLSTTANSIADPLPPMLRLTSYAGFFRYMYQIRRHGDVHDLNIPHQHQILWLLRHNRATLRHILFEQAPLLSVRLLRDCCRTISQLNNLRTLRLTEPKPSNVFTLQALRALFFSCPGSLVELEICGGIERDQDGMSLDPQDSDWDFDQGPLLPRQEPLYHLKTLELPAVKRQTAYPAPFLSSIFKHCPALNKLKLPSITHENEIQDISKVLGEHCPGITNLSLPTGWSSNGEILTRIMEQIPGPQLEVIHVCELFESPSSLTLITAIARHSETLRKILLGRCQGIESATLQAILLSCRALESLQTQDYGSKNNSLWLKDAIGTEWACTRIRRLEIAVTFTPDGRDPGYLADQTMATWTKQDHLHWEMLDKFYTQVGALVELEVLNIKSTGRYLRGANEVAGEFPFRTTCLPGLLALEDAETEQIGYLSRWSELTKLRELRGSFLWTNSEARARMGEREVEWFATHLPALRRTTFLGVPFKGTFSNDIPVILQDLHSRRPDIEFDYDLEVNENAWWLPRLD